MGEYRPGIYYYIVTPFYSSIKWAIEGLDTLWVEYRKKPIGEIEIE